MPSQSGVPHTKLDRPDGWVAVSFEQKETIFFREQQMMNKSKPMPIMERDVIKHWLKSSHIWITKTDSVELRNTLSVIRQLYDRLLVVVK